MFFVKDPNLVRVFCKRSKFSPFSPETVPPMTPPVGSFYFCCFPVVHECCSMAIWSEVSGY